MNALNPYTAGNPIGEATAFFGREDVLKQVRQMLRSPSERAVVLFGQRRIGKTSVLLQLERELERTGTATPVYFNLQDKATKPLAEVLYELAQRIAAKTGVNVPPSSEFDAAGTYFRETFLPAATERAAGRGLVLLFDEFDVLDSPSERRAGQTFFPYLRAWMNATEHVRFVFVIGRRPEDLSIDTISAFKGVRAARVSLLDDISARAVIRQSERDGGLQWTEKGVTAMLEWTHGHAFLTQLLASVVWENALETDPTGVRAVEASHVTAAIDEAIRQGANAFQWIWDGLPPAERVVIAAMAEGPSAVITQEQLTEILSRSGVRLIVRELELAPDTLVEWELLRPESGGYAFTVPLFRDWVSKHRPLRRVKDELDRLDPLAEALFQTGQQFYGLGQNDDAQAQLRRALAINPNHLKSRLLLGRLLLETERADESVAVLKEAYEYDRTAARAELIRALLASAEDKDEEQQIVIYSQVLKIDPNQRLGRERLEQINTARRLRELALTLKAGEEHEAAESWLAAINLYTKLLQEFPDEDGIRARLVRAQSRSTLAQRYTEAVAALDNGDTATAQSLLAQVISEEPSYKEAPRHLLRATAGVDVAALMTRLGQADDTSALTKLEEQVRRAGEIQAKAIAELKQRDETINRLIAETKSAQAKLDEQTTATAGLQAKLAKALFEAKAHADERAGVQAKLDERARVIDALQAKLARALATAEIIESGATPPEKLDDRIVKTLERARKGETVICPICARRMTREQLIQHAATH